MQAFLNSTGLSYLLSYGGDPIVGRLAWSVMSNKCHFTYKAGWWWNLTVGTYQQAEIRKLASRKMKEIEEIYPDLLDDTISVDTSYHYDLCQSSGISCNGIQLIIEAISRSAIKDFSGMRQILEAELHETFDKGINPFEEICFVKGRPRL